MTVQAILGERPVPVDYSRLNATVLLAARLVSGLASGLTTAAATAALAELDPSGDPRRASALAVTMNMGGLAAGALIAGLFAQYLPAPTRLVYGVHLAAVGLIAAALRFVPETVTGADHAFPWKPLIGYRTRHAARSLW